MRKNIKNKPLTNTIIQKILDRAIVINAACKEQCRDFLIMESPMHEDTLILRWLVIDISDIDRPLQCYRYECFYLDGAPQNCSINYSNQEEANEFFSSLTTLYRQQYAIDHKIYAHVPAR